MALETILVETIKQEKVDVRSHFKNEGFQVWPGDSEGKELSLIAGTPGEGEDELPWLSSDPHTQVMVECRCTLCKLLRRGRSEDIRSHVACPMAHGGPMVESDGGVSTDFKKNLMYEDIFCLVMEACLPGIWGLRT